MNRDPLIAPEGMWYTDGVIYAKKIFLEVGKDDKAFYKITDEEYRKLFKVKEEEEVNGYGDFAV